MLQNTQFGMSGPTPPPTDPGPGFEILTTAPRLALAVTPHPDDCERLRRPCPMGTGVWHGSRGGDVHQR